MSIPRGRQRLGARAGQGFSLIELMIVVAIVAILGSLAYPAYTDSIRKGRRAEARTALMELLQQQERYLTQRNTYMCFPTGTGCQSLATAEQTFKTFSGDKKANAAYSLTAELCDAPNNQIRDCVKLVATPAIADPEAGSLWLTSTGQKGCSTNSTKPRVCW